LYLATETFSIFERIINNWKQVNYGETIEETARQNYGGIAMNQVKRKIKRKAKTILNVMLSVLMLLTLGVVSGMTASADGLTITITNATEGYTYTAY